MDADNTKKLADFKERMAQEREFKMRSQGAKKTHFVKKQQRNAAQERRRRTWRNQ